MSRASSFAVRPPLSLLLAVALVSAAVLGFEIALARVFATILRYQFAFLVVSLALCGLGLGGLIAHRWRGLTLEGAALFWGVSSAMTLLAINRLVFAFVPQHPWLAALLILVPFSAAGAFLALAFERHAAWGGRLYAYDLGGAALAAIACVGAMTLLGAPGACLLFGALGALGAALLKRRRAGLAVGAALLMLVPLNARLDWWGVPAIPPHLDERGFSLADRGLTQPLFTELGDERFDSQILDTRWNAFARTDVVRDADASDALLLYTNGNVPSNMMRWDGRIESIEAIASDFPLADWSFEGAALEGANVLSIGPGGGLDALLALRHGAARFEGAEINGDIVALMDEPRYLEWNGGIYRRPEVEVAVAEGRAFVRERSRAGQRYGLVFSALTKTATAGQGAALLESFIYTSDAFADYLEALDATGQVAIVGDANPLLARLFATGVAHFVTRGQSEAQAGSHMAIVFDPRPGPYRWALIIAREPIDAARAARFEEGAARRGLVPLWIPGRAASNQPYPFAALASGGLSLDAFVRAGLRPSGGGEPLDFSPAPDDRPFVLDLAASPWAIFRASPSLSALLGLSVGGTFALAALLLLSAPRSGPNSNRERGRHSRDRALAPGVLYFGTLGVGFMLIEIPLLQKLVLPLGYPTLALTVILFSILLGGGLGALWSQRQSGSGLARAATLCALGVVVAGMLAAWGAGPLGRALLGVPLGARIALIALTLLPLGFLLGVPFPAGLRLWAREGVDASFVPLIWALNGTASVVGSIAAAVAARALGFSGALLMGALVYALAALLLRLAPRPEAPLEYRDGEPDLVAPSTEVAA